MRYLRTAGLVVAVALLTLLSASGKSSRLVMRWKNPAYGTVKKFNRVLALGLSDKTIVRLEFEDALAAQLAKLGIEAIPGNTRQSLNYFMLSRSETSTWSADSRRIKPARGYSMSRKT